MIEELVFKTPENWVQLLRDLHLSETGRNFEVDAAHLCKQGLRGVYTEYSGLGKVADDRRNFQGYKMRIESSAGGQGRSMPLDSVVPTIIPNPVHLHFYTSGSKDIEFVLDFLQKFNDSGYKFQDSSLGLYLMTWTSKYRASGMTMGFETTRLTMPRSWMNEGVIEELGKKYELIKKLEVS